MGKRRWSIGAWKRIYAVWLVINRSFGVVGYHLQSIGTILDNTSYHSATQTPPYEIVFGQPPPIHLPCLAGESRVQVLAKSLQVREDMLLLLKFHLLRAQHRMKQVADKHRSERSFEIGDWVFVKLQLYIQQSLVQRSS